MAVRAWLEGHSFDLGALAQLFSEGDPCVAADGAGFFLTSADFDGLINSSKELYDVAASTLRQINGVARVVDSGFRPVTLVGRFTDDVGNVHAVVSADTIEARSQVFAVAVVATPSDQPQPEPPPPGPGFVQLAKAHPDLSDALRILGQPSSQLGWVDLYKVFEIVRGSAGSGDALVSQNLASRATISAFCVSANQPTVSGDDARHARLPGDIPKKTMTLPEARAWIGKLVVGWMSSLKN